MSGELLMAGVPFKFEARNPYPKYTRLRSGDCYKLTIEISEDDWNTLKTMPSNALLDCWMLFTDGDPVGDEQAAEPVKPKKVKAEKGAWGAFWQQMYKAGFNNNPDLLNVLQCDSDGVKAALKVTFQVDSLTFISPLKFATWCTENELHSLATMTNRIAFEKE